MGEQQGRTVATEVVDGELDTVAGGDAHLGSVPGIDEIDDVLRVNRSFYEAFEARDLAAMSDVWEHSDRVICTHPGWSRLEGWGSVSASFYALFDGSAPIQFILTAERAEVVADTAWVSVDENILGEDAGATAAAVNLFVRNGSGWRMVLHHSSQIIAS
jgi:ketosteroid isomerase-like protein